MSTQHIYGSESIRVHKCSCRPYMPECYYTLRTLHVYVSICICEACKRCLLMGFGMMKLIGINFVVVLIFY